MKFVTFILFRLFFMIAQCEEAGINTRLMERAKPEANLNATRGLDAPVRATCDRGAHGLHREAIDLGTWLRASVAFKSITTQKNSMINLPFPL